MKCVCVCVKHRDGWCATRLRQVRYRDSIKTLCNHYVTMPYGVELREPTCALCLAQRGPR